MASATRVDQRRQASGGIAARRLDLDDLGAEIRKQFSAITERIPAADLTTRNSESGKTGISTRPVMPGIMFKTRGASSHPDFGAACGAALANDDAIAEISGFMKNAPSGGVMSGCSP